MGVWGAPGAAGLAALGSMRLQHRGQEAAGIVSHDESRFYQRKGLGLVGMFLVIRGISRNCRVTAPLA